MLPELPVAAGGGKRRRDNYPEMVNLGNNRYCSFSNAIKFRFTMTRRICPFYKSSLSRTRHFMKQRTFTKTFAEVTYACWLCEYRNVKGWYKDGDTETFKREPESKFQGRLNNWNFHPLPVHSFSEILTTICFFKSSVRLWTCCVRYVRNCVESQQRHNSCYTEESNIQQSKTQN